ncbi:MAG: cytochrome c biogenesis protein CcsA [Gammaproteobacteria bacterium]
MTSPLPYIVNAAARTLAPYFNVGIIKEILHPQQGLGRQAAGGSEKIFSMTVVLGLTSIVLYLAATLLLGLRLTTAHGSAARVRSAVVASGLAALCAHGALLYHAVVTDAGLNLGFFNTGSLMAWVIVLFLLLASLSKPVDNLGIFVLPLAAFTVLMTLLYPSDRVRLEQTRFGVDVHIILSILAASVITIAAFQAVLLAYQERHLRQKRPGRLISRLPPMQTQEGLLFQMIGLGFFLLSLSLVSGMMFLRDMFAQHLVHKTILSLFAWLVFAVLLWGRWRYGWRGRQAIRWSLAGFFTLMLAYFGSKLVLELILDRSWHAPISMIHPLPT